MEPASFSGYDGLSMVIKTPEQRRVTVDYLRINLSSSGLKPDLLEWRFLSEASLKFHAGWGRGQGRAKPGGANP